MFGFFLPLQDQIFYHRVKFVAGNKFSDEIERICEHVAVRVSQQGNETVLEKVDERLLFEIAA